MIAMYHIFYFNFVITPLLNQDIDLSSLFQPKFHTRILALEVYCSLKDRGCEWTGQLQRLDAHLDLTTGDCVYVNVDCSNKYG